MGSGSWLLFQAIRGGLDAGGPQDVDWAIAVLAVTTTVLGYHLVQLRSDLALTRSTVEAQPVEAQRAAAQPVPTPAVLQDATGRATEALGISGPSGADFEALIAAIRSQLPEGYTLRVLPTTDS